MKYIVELKYTNPSHEHVSLRRRVESRNAIVEANTSEEAILRVSRQQRALGFKVESASIVESSHDTDKRVAGYKMSPAVKAAQKKSDELSKVEKPVQAGTLAAQRRREKMKEEAKGTESYPLLKPGQKLKPMKLKIKEGFDPEPSDIAAELVKKHGKGKVTKDHVDDYERNRDSNVGIDKEAVMKHVQKMSEEIQSIEEGVPTAQKVMNRANVVAKTNPDPKKRFAASGLARKAMLRTINPTGVNTGIVRGGGNKTYRKVTGKVPPYQLTKKTGVSEEVEQVTEAKVNVNDPKKAKVQIALNKIKSRKMVNMQPTLDTEKK